MTLGLVDRLALKLRPETDSFDVIEVDNLDSLINRESNKLDQSKTCHVLVSPWGWKLKYGQKIKEYFEEQGISFVQYEFPRGILSEDVEKTRESFLKIKKMLVHDYLGLIGEGYDTINIIGISLGCVSAQMMVNGLSGVDGYLPMDSLKHLQLVLPGDCLAKSLWDGLRTRKIRDKLIEKNVSRDELINAWGDLAPVNNLVSGPNTDIYLSPSDLIIPYNRGQNLAEHYSRINDGNVSVHKIPLLGHYGTFMLFCKKPDLFFS